MNFCCIQNMIIYWPRSSHLNSFEEPYNSTVKGRIACWRKYFSRRLCRSQRRKYRDFWKKINECHVIEEESEIKIVEKINEDPIIEKDLEVKMVETIEEEFDEEIFKDLNEIKLYDYQYQDPFILW